MNRRHMSWITAASSSALAALAILALRSQPGVHAAQGQQQVQGPRFETDLYWPKPLPRHQLLGSVAGLAIDAQDHILVVNLTDSFVERTETGATSNPPVGECCMPTSHVVEFDPNGNVVRQWGGPGAGYSWPAVSSGIGIDPQGNVWIGGAGGQDSQILKFSRDGKFIAAIGRGSGAPSAAAGGGRGAADTAYLGVSGAGRGAGGARGGGGRGGPALPANSNAMDTFGGATAFAFDAAANEAFVADGSRNHRIAVVDVATGAIKRVIGAYGKAPTDGPATSLSATAQQFGNPVACVELSTDGLLYVCDRANNRIQVFRKNGEFVREGQVAPNTKGAGSVWDIAFSRDAQQQHLYIADGQNAKVRVLDRQTLREITNFGDGGRQAGKFMALHSIVTDSRGNVITGEAMQGKRIQRFMFKGITNVAASQGVVWPGRTP